MNPSAGSDNNSILAAINPPHATHPIIPKKRKIKNFLRNLQYGNNPIYFNPYLLTPLSPTLNLFFWTDSFVLAEPAPPPIQGKKKKKTP